MFYQKLCFTKKIIEQSFKEGYTIKVDAAFKFHVVKPGLEVIKLKFILKLKIKRNDWLLVDTCPQAANHCALF